MASPPPSSTPWRRQATLDVLLSQRVVPVLRATSATEAATTALACVRGGLPAVELTMTTSDVLDVVPRLVDSGAVVGLGTVRSRAEVTRAARASACFVVSFERFEGFVATAHAHDLVAIPGAFTPSEVARAASDAPDLVKLFPGRLGGPAYLADLRPLFPTLRWMVTGGVSTSLESLAAWFAAGAAVLGIGSAVGLATTVGAAEVERRCAEIVAQLTRSPAHR